MKIYMFVPYFISCCHSSDFKQNTRNHNFGWVSTPSFINVPPFSKIAIHLSRTLAFSFYNKPYHLDCTIKYINIIKCISFIPLYIYMYIYIYIYIYLYIYYIYYIYIIYILYICYIHVIYL